jgi:hypothetical protein
MKKPLARFIPNAMTIMSTAAFEAEEASELLRKRQQHGERSGFDVGTGCRTYGHQSAYYLTWEKNASRMSIQTLVRYARACGVNFKIQQV